MSLAYRAIDWNRQKRVYDLTMIGGVLLAIATYVTATLVRHPNVTVETLILRGTALGAIALLHVILAIGPLARLDSRFLPLLYNRRHLGVTLFALAVVHAVFSVVQFHALGDEFPLVSVWTAYERDAAFWRQPLDHWVHIPFEPFGVLALLILLLMAATSHDFWLRHLGSAFWKSLHLGVYLAYGLVLVHVVFGYVQSERGYAAAAALSAGLIGLVTLHLLAAQRERRIDRGRQALKREGFVPVAAIGDVEEGRGRVVVVDGRRLAVWRHRGRWFATSNVCRHQGGPLGEGRIVDGCITCPWHGWNYQPEDGCSPPPFQEVIETHEVRVDASQVWIRSRPSPLRTRHEGAEDGAHRPGAALPSKDPIERTGTTTGRSSFPIQEVDA